jgi:hypothetical protein
MTDGASLTVHSSTMSEDDKIKILVPADRSDGFQSMVLKILGGKIGFQGATVDFNFSTAGGYECTGYRSFTTAGGDKGIGWHNQAAILRGFNCWAM